MRQCKTCQHLKRPEIDRRLAAGEPTALVARDYELNPSSLHRHRTNCLGLSSSNAIMKDAARGTAAVALLPSKETLSDSYRALCERIDQIVDQAQREGSLAVAVSGLNSLRQTLDSRARLAGHIGAAGTQINVAIQNNLNINVAENPHGSAHQTAGTGSIHRGVCAPIARGRPGERVYMRVGDVFRRRRARIAWEAPRCRADLVSLLLSVPSVESTIVTG